MNTRPSEYFIPEILRKKKDDEPLSKEEIKYFVKCVTEFEKAKGKEKDERNTASLPIQEAQIGLLFPFIK